MRNSLHFTMAVVYISKTQRAIGLVRIAFDFFVTVCMFNAACINGVKGWKQGAKSGRKE